MEQNHIHEHTKVADMVALFNMLRHTRTGRKPGALYQLTDCGSQPAAGVEHVLNLMPHITMADLMIVNTILVGMLVNAYDGDQPPSVNLVWNHKRAAVDPSHFKLATFKALVHGNVLEEVSVTRGSLSDQYVFVGVPEGLIKQLLAINSLIEDIERQCSIAPIMNRRLAHYWAEITPLLHKIRNKYPIPAATYANIDKLRSLKSLMSQLPQLQSQRS